VNRESAVNKTQTRFYDADAKAINHDPDTLVRTQDLEPWFEENSNLYIFTRDSFNRTQARIGKRPMMLETPLFESTDIDTPDDWALAEVMVKYYQEKGLLL
jgi:CMP-N-acetylneuraminic acid synthetase